VAWAFVQTVQGGSLEEYEKVTAELGDIGLPDGLIVHVAGAVEEGFRVINVWESQEQYERFRDIQLLPAMERAFGHPPDAPTRYEPMEVHHLIAR
jgi:hypothetical protein